MVDAPPPYPGIDPNLTPYPPPYPTEQAGAYPPPQQGAYPPPPGAYPPPQQGAYPPPPGYPLAQAPYPPPQANGQPTNPAGKGECPALSVAQPISNFTLPLTLTWPPVRYLSSFHVTAAKEAEAAASAAYYSSDNPHNVYMPEQYPQSAPPAYSEATKKEQWRHLLFLGGLQKGVVWTSGKAFATKQKKV